MILYKDYMEMDMEAVAGNISINRMLLLLAATMLFTGCIFKNSLENLKRDYKFKEKYLVSLVSKMEEVYNDTGCKGFSITTRGLFSKKSLITIHFFDKEPLELDTFIKDLNEDNRKSVYEMIDVANKASVKYANLNKRGYCWIVVSGGGVLGSDSGYLFTGGTAINNIEFLNEYTPLDKEGLWYAGIT